MSHHCGFTLKVLINTLTAKVFPFVVGMLRHKAFDLWLIDSKVSIPESEMRYHFNKV
jgi:hypothetical protein